MKSAYGVSKNIAKNIGEQVAMTGIISSGQFGFSVITSQWRN